jgi:hypothetical protein
MEPKGSLPCSQVCFIGPYSEPDEPSLYHPIPSLQDLSSHLCPCLSSGLLLQKLILKGTLRNEDFKKQKLEDHRKDGPTSFQSWLYNWQCRRIKTHRKVALIILHVTIPKSCFFQICSWS